MLSPSIPPASPLVLRALRSNSVYPVVALLLAAGLTALCAGGAARAALTVAAVALTAVATVNAHDLATHLAGVDWRVGLARYDAQLELVEFFVPALHAAGRALAGRAQLQSSMKVPLLVGGLLFLVAAVLNRRHSPAPRFHSRHRDGAKEKNMHVEGRKLMSKQAFACT